MFARELSEPFHFFSDVAHEVALCSVAVSEHDVRNRIVSDESAVFLCPLEVGEESVADGVDSVAELSFAPEIDVHGDESAVLLPEVCEC